MSSSRLPKLLDRENGLSSLTGSMKSSAHQEHAVQTFRDVDQARREYAQVTDQSLNPLGPESVLSNFYTPSPDHKDRDIIFVILGLATTGLLAYRIAKQ